MYLGRGGHVEFRGCIDDGGGIYIKYGFQHEIGKLHALPSFNV